MHNFPSCKTQKKQNQSSKEKNKKEKKRSKTKESPKHKKKQTPSSEHKSRKTKVPSIQSSQHKEEAKPKKTLNKPHPSFQLWTFFDATGLASVLLLLLLLLQQQQQQSPCNSNPRENSITQKLKIFASVFSNPMMISVFFFFPFFKKLFENKKSLILAIIINFCLVLPSPFPSLSPLKIISQPSNKQISESYTQKAISD
jgi:DNA mismatch repair ATPase MutL